MKLRYFFILFIFLLVGCVKHASNEFVSYDDVVYKFNNSETFILSIVDDKDKEYKEFNNNLNEIVNKYNINVTTVNVRNLSDNQIDKLKEFVDYNDLPIVVFIEDGVEANNLNRIIGNISVDRMIDVFKSAEYID